MASRSGCKTCRDRHIRCITEEGAESCEHCAKKKHTCTRLSNLKFKVVRSVPQRRHGDTGRVFFVYSPTQTWVSTPAAVDFVADPCGLKENVESLVSSPESPRSNSPASQSPCSPPAGTITHGDISIQASEGLEDTAISGLLGLRNLGSNTEAAISNQWHLPPPEIREPHYRTNYLLPSSPLELSGSPPLNIPRGVSSSFHSPASQLSVLSRSSNVQLSGREAILFRCYIENLSPTYDAGDPMFHFGTVVPQRAMQHPILLHAMFAVAAKHMSLVLTYDAAEGSHYYNECISLLIPTIVQAEENYDENLLAATVILRSYEEMSDEDNRCHLLGSTRLLDSITRFSSSGGLGEAASWVILRQAIYISMVSKEPVSIRFENYEQSQTFAKQNDYSWTNTIVFLFAKVLSMAFVPQENVLAEDWLGLEAAIEEWNVSKPDTFNPLSVNQGSSAPQSAFPEIWMLAATHVIGVQHYYLAKLFTLAYKPLKATPGFDFLKASRERENYIITNVGAIVGLALGNPKVPTGWFTASHTLSACGCYLRRPEERQVALDFLKDMQKTIGWKSQIVVSLLKEQWNALDEDYSR